jgi:uncharacterized membrane protein
MSSATVYKEDEVPDEIERVSYDGDDIENDAPCPICGEKVNHVIRNGYRNQWPPLNGKRVTVCTDDRPVMFVHVVDSEAQDAYEEARKESEQRQDRETD